MSVNLSNSTPAAPAGNTNVTWQADGSGNISGYLPTSAPVTTSVNLTAQNANVAATTLLAVSSSGFFRVGSYAIVTTVDGASSTLPSVAITWTDPDNSTGQTFTLTPTNTGNLLTTFQQGLMVFKAKSGSNIQYSTSGYASGTPGTMKFSLALRLESL